MKAKGLTDIEIEAVVNWLINVGYVSDKYNEAKDYVCQKYDNGELIIDGGEIELMHDCNDGTKQPIRWVVEYVAILNEL